MQKTKSAGNPPKVSIVAEITPPITTVAKSGEF